MKPHDLIVWRDDKIGNLHVWEIEGVHLGAEGQESLIELRSKTHSAGVAHGEAHMTVFVPEPLLRGRVYAKQS